MRAMPIYTEGGYSYFYDYHIGLWTVYPVDEQGDRIEHDIKGDPIECTYFNNRRELEIFMNH